MNTILHLKALQSPISITNPSHLLPWKRKPDQISPSRRSIRLHSRSTNGFGNTSNDGNNANVQKKRPNPDDDDEISPVVFDRMMRRIVVFVASPIATGVGLLYVMSALKDNRIWDVPVWLPFVTTLVLFGTSALGIAYGTLSSSWEAEREGSLLGWEEARKNWPELWKEDDKDKTLAP